MKCNSCVHKSICKYKDEYEKLFDNIISLAKSEAESQYPYRFKIEINCKDYVVDYIGTGTGIGIRATASNYIHA